MRAIPRVHKHVCPEFYKSNANLIQHSNMTVVCQLNVGKREKSKLDNGGQRNLDSEEQKLGNGEEPNVGPKGSGSYLRPKTHIQHTYPQHLSTSTQTSTNHKSTHCNRMG